MIQVRNRMIQRSGAGPVSTVIPERGGTSEWPQMKPFPGDHHRLSIVGGREPEGKGREGKGGGSRALATLVVVWSTLGIA